MTTQSVTQAIRARGAVRAFTDQPVTRETIEEILKLAGRAPSNINSSELA